MTSIKPSMEEWVFVILKKQVGTLTSVADQMRCTVKHGAKRRKQRQEAKERPFVATESKYQRHGFIFACVEENPVSVIGIDLFRMCQRKAQEDPVLKK